MKRSRRKPVVIGWREWVGLPDLGIAAIKAKIDTGARTSAIHAFRPRIVEDGDERLIHFSLHPVQHHRRPEIACIAPLVGHRHIRSSNGQIEERLVIATTMVMAGVVWPVQLTLTNRDDMGFRMLIGRRALRRRFLVDPSRSYVFDDPKMEPVGKPAMSRTSRS